MGDRTIIEERRLSLEQSWSPRSRWEDEGVGMVNEASPVLRLAQLIERVSCEFAGGVDWLSGTCAYVDGCARLLITENEPGLHQGRYIRLNAVPVGNTLRVTGGYYDKYFRPVTICEKSLPLSLLDERMLSEVFAETHTKLTRYRRIRLF